MDKKIFNYSDKVWGVIDFITSEQCKQFIAKSETTGFDEAAINVGGHQEVFKQVRNNERILFDDLALAESLFIQLKPYIPEQIEDWRVSGLNERFRFYRYDKYQFFRWHKDGVYKRSEHEESKLTFMIYLNDEFDGGSTDFKCTEKVEGSKSYEEYRVWPKSGMALLFYHKLLHQGAPITHGRKYILRTDVMYTRNSA